MSNTLQAVTYLQIKRDGGLHAKVVKATQHMPSRPEPDCIVVKVKVALPRAAFDPLTAEVTVPADVVHFPVKVEAQP